MAAAKLSELAGIFHEYADRVTDDWETVKCKTEAAITKHVAGMDWE